MSTSITVTKRSSGGYTILVSALTKPKYASKLEYCTYNNGVKLIDSSKDDSYGIHDYSEWTINGVTNFQSILEVCNALDAIGVVSQKNQIVDSANVEKGDIIRTFKVSIALPANTNPYSAGDVITDISGALSQLTNVAKAAGYGVTIVGVRVQTTDQSGLAGKNLRWHIFNDSITPIADNAAFAINDVNTDKREGTITVTMGTGTLSKVGQANYENISLNPVSRNIYLVLEHVDGGTPSAVSTVINAYFKVLLTN